MIDEIGFELHRNGRVDVALAVTSASDLERLARHNDWPASARLACAWPAFIDAVCLELDSDRAGAEPSVFFVPDAYGHEVACANGDWHPAWLDVAALVRGEPLAAATRALLARCCAALPASARLCYIGVMPSRGSSAIRVCIRNPSAQEVGTFLSDVGWNGNRALLSPLLEIAESFNSLLTLHLDVAATLSSRIGIEIAPRFPGDESQWPDHVAALVRASLLDRATADVMLAWGDPTRCRRINHVKVAYDGNFVESKAYLGAVWRDSSLRFE